MSPRRPLLRDLHQAPKGEAYRAAVARGARFFNAHPYLCGMAVGAAARAEHDGVPAEQIERLRTALSGPLGSLGDRLVWAGWLPFNSGLALAGDRARPGWSAIVGFLVLYNIGHVGLRWWALKAGWTHGLRVADALRHRRSCRRAGAFLAPAMAVVTGAAFPLVVRYLGSPFPGWARVVLTAAAVAGVLLLQWRSARIDGPAAGSWLRVRRADRGVAMAMVEREAQIVNPLGMHARPAAEFVKVANRFKSTISLRQGER